MAANIDLQSLEIKAGSPYARDGFWDMFFGLMQEGHLPQTCVPPGETFEEHYTKAAERHDNVLAMHVTSKLSGFFNAGRLAARALDLDNIAMYDSESASVGLGFMAAHASKLLQSGMELEEVLPELKHFRENTLLMGRPATLKYLYNGGRLRRSQFLMSAALNIKVVMQYWDNELTPIKKTLGYSGAKNDILDRLVQRFKPGSEITYSVMHALAPDHRDEWLADIEQLYPDGTYIESSFGPGLGAHLGPHAVAIFAVPGRIGEPKLTK